MLVKFPLNSYERVFLQLKSSKAGRLDRLPCINPTSTATLEFMEATGAHWPEAHLNPEKMAKLGSAAHRLAGLDNVSIPFDLTVEAEALGAKVDYGGGAQPTWPKIEKYILDTSESLELPRDLESAGRIPILAEALKILKEEFKGEVPVNVFINPPFTCLSHYLHSPQKFFGILLKEPEKVKAWMDTLTEASIRIVEVYVEAGADIVTLHEMAGTLISPKHFEEFVEPYLKKLTAKIRCPTILSICGSALRIVDMMVRIGANAIALDEKTSLGQARRKADRIRPNYPIAGNISPKLLCEGTPNQILQAVKEAIAEGVSLVAPGCDFMLETPTENIRHLVDAVEKLSME